MNNIIKQIEIDLYTPTFYEVIKAQQNDENSRFVEFILYNQGEPYVIPKNVLIKLEGQRANKSPFIKPCTVANNVVTVELDKDLLYYSGVAHLKLVIYKEDENSVLSTIPFTVSIQKNPLDSNKFEKDNYSLVHQLVLQTETNTKNLNNEIERAKEAEKVITDNLNAEIARAKKAESDEATRATNAEKVLTDNLSAEITRAKNAESANATAINNEVTRAKAAEKVNSDNISANATAINNEVTRAKNAESNLDSKKANIDSPTFTGIPKAPTASAGTNTTQVATTAFTQNSVANHNTSTTSHVDIRDLITELTNRLNALADSDDTTLDQLSEIVAYINSNRTLIESVTTSKVNVSDIIDNLTSTATNKPLSANQGRLLKELIDSLKSALDTHISNSDIHITASERTNWNTVTNKVDKIEGKGLSSNDYTDEEKNKLAYLANNLGNVQNTDTTISSKVTGLTTATVTDSMKSNVISFKTNGYTNQKTGSGKNLLDIEHTVANVYQIESYEITNGVITMIPMQGVSSGYVELEIDGSLLELNERYTISCKTSNTTPAHMGIQPARIEFVLGDRMSENNLPLGEVNGFDEVKGNFSLYVPPHIQEPVVFIRLHSFGGYEYKYYDIQIEKGNVATSYEPYTGGISFPNPDNPEPIQGYGDTNCFDGELIQGTRFSFMGGKWTIYDNVVSRSDFVSNKNSISCKKGDEITIEYPFTSGVKIGIGYYDGDSWISGDYQYDTNSAMFTVPDNVDIDNFYFYIECTSITQQTAEHITVLKNGTYCAPIKSVGKNLLDNLITYQIPTPGVNYETTDLPRLTISPDTKFFALSQRLKQGSYCISCSENYALSINRISLNGFTNSFTNIYISRPDRYSFYVPYEQTVIFGFERNVSRADTTDIAIGTTDLSVFEIQIEEGGVPTDYEPYSQSIALIPTTQPFYEGDYIQLNADGTGVEHRENKKIVIDGDTVRLIGADGYRNTGLNYAYLITNDRKLLNPSIFSNIGANTNSYIEGVAYSNDNKSISVCIKDERSGITSADTKEERISKINAWCQYNPVEVVYELAAPTDTPLTAEQLSEIKKLMSFDRQTTFSTEPYNTRFKIEYYKNTDNGIVVGGLNNALNDKTKNLSAYAKKSIYDDTTMNLGRRPDQDIGLYSVAQGYNVIASGVVSHAEGQSTMAIGDNSHTEGFLTSANGDSSHAEGHFTSASGDYSHAEGYNTIASGYYSHAQGFKTTARNDCSLVAGHYNIDTILGGSPLDTTGSAFVIGNGTNYDALSNAFSVMFDGTVKAKSTITGSTTADYAEFFEWIDGNPKSEDRVGRFVTLDGDKIRYANEKDDYILGIVSGEPFVLGNGDCDTWNGMYLKDEFNRTIYEPAPKVETIVDEKTGEVTFEELFDEDGNPVYEGTRPVLNPEYDPSKPYISRFDRPEWSPVGMLGVLSVYDDGTCKVNGYCKCNEDGIATKSDTGYRVIARVSDNIIKVNFSFN